MRLSFKRITSSGNFIPEIDGLRFIAIASVVLYHLSGFLTEKDHNQYTDGVNFSALKHILSHGHIGVPLFFVISGFILGMPFAKSYLMNGSSVNIGNYFFRRLTRLEPPYILVMTVLLFGSVYVSKTVTLSDGLTSYFASIFYSHNFIYGRDILPLLNGVAWSLEIEIQFYILAPLMGYIFLVKSPMMRRLSLVILAIIFLIVNHNISLPFRSLIEFFQYFLVGFLLADLYVSKSTILPKTKFDYLIGLIFFLTIWMFDKKDFNSNSQQFIWELIQLMSIFFLYYYVLFNKVFKVLSFKLITNIGGMCYSIYLLHYPIISMFGNPLLRRTFSDIAIINVSIYSILLLLAIMCISSLFFVLIERPCMDKDWYKKVFNRKSKDTFAYLTSTNKTHSDI